MTSPVSVIIMAAGKGTRLKSRLPKVLHPLFGLSLLERVLRCLDHVASGLAGHQNSLREAFLLVGHGRETVISQTLTKRTLYTVTPVIQEPQRGTGHAVQQVLPNLPQTTADQVLVLSGDVPLLAPTSIQALLEAHKTQQNDLTVLVATLDNPFGYGRVITEPGTGNVLKIVEQKDATAQQQQTQTVNTGIYCLNWSTIAPLLSQISSNNAQGEFYLTDTIALALEQDLRVGTVNLMDPDEMLGVNSRADLALCHDILNRRTQKRLMDNGVTLISPQTTSIAPEVKIEADTTIYPGCVLEGNVTVGEQCVIGPNTWLSGLDLPVSIGNRVEIFSSVLRGVTIADDVSIGPFAHLRGGVTLGEQVRIGNFVEIKNSTLGSNTNAAHLSYIGDADLGSEVNMGAGSITANYDPIRKKKYRTTIGNGVKVGCNAVLVAPLTVGANACVAAGSVIDQDVDNYDLAIARARQTVIPGWVEKTLAKTC